MPTYEKSGIADIREFYARKFAVQRNFDFTRTPLNFFDIHHFKFLWMYSMITDNSRVLDFGCGSGSLASLKRKGCHLVGVDLSDAALEVARGLNGYDEVYCGDLFDDLPLGEFDYVVSIDVFGHVPFEIKDQTIARLKSFLRPGGVMLHGIECGPVDYEAMSPEKLQAFVSVDGHVGIESKIHILERFGRCFAHVDGEVRYDLVNSAEEYLYQAKEYQLKLCPDLLNYLEAMNPDERRAFNVASGMALIRLEEQEVPSRDGAGGFLFLRASDRPLKPRKIAVPAQNGNVAPNLLADERVFTKGWYPVETPASGPFRWGLGRAQLSFEKVAGDELQITIFSGYPQITRKPVDVYFLTGACRRILQKVTLSSTAPVHVTVPLAVTERRQVEIFVETTWIPALLMKCDDTRELGVGMTQIIVS